MKVLMINGSPNREGCTFTALTEVAGTLDKEGISSEIISLGKTPIRGCTACMLCKQSGKCVFTDDPVNDTIDKMKSCDGLILGSPVHYAGPAGAIHSFCDRLFYAGDAFIHKPGAAVVSARRAGTTASLDVLQKYFIINGMPIVPSKYWTMVHGTSPDEVRKDLEGMQAMRMLGRNMAWLLKAIDAGKKAGIDPPILEEPDERTNFIR